MMGARAITAIALTVGLCPLTVAPSGASERSGIPELRVSPPRAGAMLVRIRPPGGGQRGRQHLSAAR